RLRPGHQARVAGADLRAVLHLRRRPGLGAGPGHRPRAGRAHARAPGGRLAARPDDLLLRAARMRSRCATPSCTKASRSRALLSLLAVAGGLALSLAGCGGSDKPASTPAPKTTTTEVKVVRAVGSGDFDPAEIYQRDAPSVVTIISVFGGGGGLLGGGGGAGQGSGFVVSDKGEIVTNAHVVTDGEGSAIRKARQVYVQFADGNRVDAKVMGFDPNADVALIKVDPGDIKL